MFFTLKGMTQEDLARKAEITKRTVINYESGASLPQSYARYQTLADALEVDVTYLLTENEAFLTEVADKYGRRGQKQAAMILNQTQQLFAGGSLSYEDELAFITEIQRMFLDSKDKARSKYTPKKYQGKSESEDTPDSK